jgi:hypothetical protein
MDERTEGEVSSLSAEMMVLQMLFVALTRAMLRSQALDEVAVAEAFAQAAELIGALPQRVGGDDAPHRERAMSILTQLRTAVLHSRPSRAAGRVPSG